jgi:hypothetical protein
MSSFHFCFALFLAQTWFIAAISSISVRELVRTLLGMISNILAIS